MAGLFDLANPALANVSGDKMGYALAPAINQMATSGLEQMMGGLGVKSKTQMVQDVLSKIDMNDPNSMIMASSELMKLGMTAEAQQLMKAAQEAQLNSVKMGSEEALIGQRNALANKHGAEVQETLTGKSKTYQIDAAIAQVERLLKEGKITQEQANVAYMNLLKANPELTQAEIVAKQRQGLPTVYNAAGIGQGEIGYASPEEVGKLAEALRQSGSVGSGKNVTNKPLHQVLSVTPEQFGKVLSGGGQASSYAMGAQQKFAEGDVDGARALWNQAMQATQKSAQDTMDIKDNMVVDKIDESLKDFRKLQSDIGTMATLAESGNIPVSWTLLQGSMPSLATNNSRADAEIQRVISSGSLPTRVADKLNTWYSGTPTQFTKDEWAQVISAMKKESNRKILDTAERNIKTFARSTFAKEDPVAFLSRNNLRVVKKLPDEISDDKPDGLHTVNGKNYAKINGKYYEVE